ncbi:Ig-like domain-containing protein [Streptomyces sp. NPDC004542]|uniref:Ig-like domain-containing protein n=1 Tax=Streptomyces sp. NPDC004542 TaxID=3154281 RepID=UPI0033AB64EC
MVLTARVAPDAPHETTPTGTVTFAVDGNDEPLSASLDGGTATVTTGPLGSGTHEITATYHGDEVFAGSTDVHTLVRIPTSMTITSVPNPSASGQPVTITATVTPQTPGHGVPTGRVVFTLTGIGNFIVPLNASGQAILTTSAFTAGVYTITGSYTGDATYLPISQSIPHFVSAAATTTTVTSAPNPSVFGQPVTVTAHVAPVPPATGTPTGTVTFTIDGAGGGTFTASLSSSGAATVSLSTLGAGPHTVTAVYNGDAFFDGSTGMEVHTVGQASTTTTVTTSPDPSVHGQPITVTATVAPVPPGAGVPTGSVLFTYDGGSRTVTLDAHGTASFTLTTPLSAGDHIITAVYGGDVNFTGSTGTHTQTVQRALTSTAVTSAPDPSHFGETVTLTVTVTPVAPGAGTPTGTVTLTVDGPGGFTRTVPLGGDGTAVVTTDTLGAAAHTVTADYNGDTDFAPSSGTDTQTVDKTATTTTATTSPNPSGVGEPVTLTATVTPVAPGAGTPTGTVIFTVAGSGGGTFAGTLDANGVASVTVDTLGVGDHTVTASYGGDADFTGSSDTTTHTVGTLTSATTVSLHGDGGGGGAGHGDPDRQRRLQRRRRNPRRRPAGRFRPRHPDHRRPGRRQSHRLGGVRR